MGILLIGFNLINYLLQPCLIWQKPDDNLAILIVKYATGNGSLLQVTLAVIINYTSHFLNKSSPLVPCDSLVDTTALLI